jgi:hypothetical protein
VPQPITESRPLAVIESNPTTPAGRLRVQVITPGWGSSGYYSPHVLETAGRNGVFPAGTQMYLDHPSWTEAQDRPERSVRDIAAVLTEAASWDDGLQALVAEAQVVGPYRELLTDPTLREAIGVSIRANATVEEGEAEGRSGVLVSELVEGVSVDFVTQAGRGGRILSVLESATRRQLAEFTPVNPAGSTHESQGGTMQQIEEARLRQLEEAAGRVSALESELGAATARANTAESALAQIRIRDAARPVARAIAAESATLPAGWQSDVVEAALTRVPVTDDGTLDETALRTAVESERTRQELRLAEALEAAGAGRVRGNGDRQQVGESGGGSGFDLDAAVTGRYTKTGA